MAELIEQTIFDKLEREWRVIDPDRPKPEAKPILSEAPKRLKISRVD